MSKYGGSEKTTQAFVAAYNKPRLSTCSIQAERPPGVLLRPGRTNPLPRVPPSVLWPHPGHRVTCGGDAVRTDPAGCYRTLFRPFTGLRRPLPPLVAPTNRGLCALWPCFLHKNSMQFYGVHQLPLPLSVILLSCSQLQGHNETFQGVGNIWLMWRPGDGNVHTEAWLLPANKYVTVVDFSSNGAYWAQSQTFCFMELRGRWPLLSLLAGSSTPVCRWYVFKHVF